LGVRFVLVTTTSNCFCKLTLCFYFLIVQLKNHGEAGGSPCDILVSYCLEGHLNNDSSCSGVEDEVQVISLLLDDLLVGTRAWKAFFEGVIK